MCWVATPWLCRMWPGHPSMPCSRSQLPSSRHWLTRHRHSRKETSPPPSAKREAPQRLSPTATLRRVWKKGPRWTVVLTVSRDALPHQPLRARVSLRRREGDHLTLTYSQTHRQTAQSKVFLTEHKLIEAKARQCRRKVLLVDWGLSTEQKRDRLSLEERLWSIYQRLELKAITQTGISSLLPPQWPPLFPSTPVLIQSETTQKTEAWSTPKRPSLFRPATYLCLMSRSKQAFTQTLNSLSSQSPYLATARAKKLTFSWSLKSSGRTSVTTTGKRRNQRRWRETKYQSPQSLMTVKDKNQSLSGVHTHTCYANLHRLMYSAPRAQREQTLDFTPQLAMETLPLTSELKKRRVTTFREVRQSQRDRRRGTRPWRRQTPTCITLPCSLKALLNRKGLQFLPSIAPVLS
ncbi:uncharacterized protein LOC134031543 [Osmerus eperlanus]|uniref:uncharacterized protein LOC134031543 n=1 Tax=Osmerus eperlanus TaxID=29151 RepID=UPI002E12ABB5